MTPKCFRILLLLTQLLLGYHQEAKAQNDIQTIKIHLEEARKKSNELDLIRLLTRGGFVLWSENEPEKAAEFFNEALTLNQKNGNQNAEAILYNHLGMIYSDLKNYELAAINFKSSLAIHQQEGDRKGEAAEYLNLGMATKEGGNPQKSIDYLKIGLEISHELNDQKMTHRFYGILAEYYQELDSTVKAMEFYNYYLAIEKHLQEELLEAKQKESSLKIQMAEAEKSVAENAKKVTQEKLVNTEVALNTAIKVGREKEIQIDLLNKENQIKELTMLEQKAQLTSAKILRNSIIGGSVMLSFLLMLAYTGYSQKKKANKMLHQQNNEITNQRDQIKSQSIELAKAFSEIREKNHKINRSIQYAKRIQEAMLSSSEKLKAYLPESFTYFVPRDIVSGDFYWFNELKNYPGKFILAAADCTGHGVPGAFMSLIANDLLHQTIFLKKIIDPKKILSELHAGLHKTLQQDKNKNMDGMDIGLCLVDQQHNKLTFAGARFPLIHIKNDALREISGNRTSVGGFPIVAQKQFSNHEITYEPGDTFYLFSDGFQDQFGGKAGDKYRHKNLLNLLLKIHGQPLTDQSPLLQQEYQRWTGSIYPQVDDMLVIGFRL